jgi:hypothetical protein
VRDIGAPVARLIEQEAYATDISEEKRAEELERVKNTPVTAVRTLRAHAGGLGCGFDHRGHIS